MKKILSFILALCMICTLLPATVLAADTQIVFEFGANGSASHNDGSSKTSYTETVDDYTLSLTGGTSMYTGARDAKGNSCIKLGTSSKVGGFSFTVPADVTSVIIAIAKYKTNTTKINVNGTAYTLNGASNSGVYDAIEVDTSSTKTITLTTVSGGVRAMVNSITYVIADSGSSCAHENIDIGVTKEPTCTETGVEEWVCSDCGATGTNTLDKTDHKLVDDEGYPASCTEPGLTSGQVCEDCDYTTQTVIPADHSYGDDGICSVCGAEEPKVAETTITFDANKTQRTEFSTSQQVWENDGVSFTNNKAGSSSNVADYGAPVRLYASSSVTVESSEGNISKIVFDCNSASYANSLKSSIGTVAGATVTVNSDKVTVEFDEAVEGFTIAKLSAQIRLDALMVTSIKAGSSTCPHTNKDTLPAEAPSCTEDGKLEGWVCTDCGYEEQKVDPATGHNLVDGEAKEATCTEAGLTAGKYCTKCDYTEQEEIPAGHKYENGVCSGCGQELPNEATITFDDTSKRTEFDTSHQVWVENGITVTNNKASSASSVADYSKPVRFYKNSTLTIAYDAEMCQIIFDCNNSSYATAMVNSIEAAGGTALKYSDKVVFVPTKLETSYTFTMSAATWIDSITVICNVAEVDGTLYTSLDAALKNTTGTLKLLIDQTIDTINVPETSDLVIDLNGKTLTVTTIVATVEDTADGVGLVKVANGSAVLHSVDGQLILWDNNASGYRAFNSAFAAAGMNLNDDDTDLVKSFWSDLDFASKDTYQLVAASGMKVGFKLEWNGKDKTFWLDDEYLLSWADEKFGNTDTERDFYFYVTVTGFVALTEDGTLKVTPVIQDSCENVIAASSAIEYEFVAG